MKLQQLQPPAPPSTFSPRACEATRRSAAIHEASHAVVAFALAAELLELKLSPPGDTAACRFTYSTPPTIADHAAIGVAGSIGEVIFVLHVAGASRPQYVPHEADGGDQASVDEACNRLAIVAPFEVTPADRREVQRQAMHRAADILIACESAVEGLAALLMRRGRLDGEQATDVLLGHGMTRGGFLER